MKWGDAVIFFFLTTALAACGSDGGNETSQGQSRHENDSEQLGPQRDTIDDSVEYIMGRFEPAEDTRFVLIDPKYADEEGMYLRKEVYEAFMEMHAAAERDGIDLTILSAARNFEVQKSIWEAKWNGKRLVEGGVNLAEEVPDPEARALRILRYSSMPGTSRHHWGTDIDLNALNNGYFEKGPGAKVYAWLNHHAVDFGFCQPYTDKEQEDRTGYEEERWHWSYMPLSNPLLRRAQDVLQNEDIHGFAGSETAQNIRVVERYVFGISEACR